MPTSTTSSGTQGSPPNTVLAVPERKINDAKISFDVLKLISEESAQHYRFAPIGLTDGVLEVGMIDPDSIEGIDALNFIARKSGTPFKIFRISQEDFDKVLGMYRGLGGDVERAVTDLAHEQHESPKHDEGEVAPLDLGKIEVKTATNAGLAQTIQEDSPTIKIASTILRYAIDGNASDVHIEPTAAGVKVRYRVDGDLHTSVILPLNTHRALVARIKVLASIRLDEQRKPQDGRFSASIDNRQIDFRVSTFPSTYGEKVVLRILDRDRGFISLDNIGLSQRNLNLLRDAIKRPHGLILISGPTGSGKSTTLYSMLSELDRERANVLSLEDPVEYFIDGVTQSQVRPEIGYTFANGLRTTLRQDPDVIMVGEIRDGETAKLAIQAALTGHLVLSSIHTNDAVGTIPRLIDMGVEPYLIPPVLIVSLAQRLVRTLCSGTGKETPMSESIRLQIEAQQQTLPEKYRFPIPNVIYEPEKSPGCISGMRGRMAVFEALEMNADLERVILKNPVDSELWRVARNQGMLTMREDAMLKSFGRQVPYSEVDTLSSILTTEEEPPVPVAPEAPLPIEGEVIPQELSDKI
jgi:type IV pilus assembly protein PilB